MSISLTAEQIEAIAASVAEKVKPHVCTLGLTQAEAEFVKRGAAISEKVKNTSILTAVGAIVMFAIGALSVGIVAAIKGAMRP